MVKIMFRANRITGRPALAESLHAALDFSEAPIRPFGVRLVGKFGSNSARRASFAEARACLAPLLIGRLYHSRRSAAAGEMRSAGPIQAASERLGAFLVLSRRINRALLIREQSLKVAGRKG